MSHDDFEGLKVQIHQRINKIEEVKDEGDDNDDDKNYRHKDVKGEDDEG